MERTRLNYVRSAAHSCGFLLCLFVAFEKPAAAYADPGSGALVWQMLVAGFVGLMFYFRRFSSWFRGRRKDHEK